MANTFMELKMLTTACAPLGHGKHCLPVPVGSHPRLHALTSNEVSIQQLLHALTSNEVLNQFGATL